MIVLKIVKIFKSISNKINLQDIVVQDKLFFKIEFHCVLWLPLKNRNVLSYGKLELLSFDKVHDSCNKQHVVQGGDNLSDYGDFFMRVIF